MLKGNKTNNKTQRLELGSAHSTLSTQVKPNWVLSYQKHYA